VLGLPADPQQRQGLIDEQMQAIAANAGLAIALALAFSLLLVWAVLPSVSVEVAWTWMLSRVAMSTVRWLPLRGKLSRQNAPVSGRLHWATLALLALDALVWGLGGAYLMAGGEVRASMVAATLACVACVATFGLQVSLPATLAYVLPMLLPPAVALAVRGDEFGSFSAAGLVWLLILPAVTARRSQRRLLASIELRQRAEQLASEKDEALRLALRQSAARSQFMGNVSHELRTPLHGILGLARLLHLDAPDERMRRRIDLIEASGRHLLTLINDLIDLSRIEAGRFPLHHESFDLGAQLEHVAAVHAVRADDKGLRFSFECDVSEPCWVSGDPARVRQVLYNLLGNAIKFTRQGEVHLHARWHADSGLLQVDVRDTGPGIHEADQERIFEAFQQATSELSEPLEGAGLGLKIARELALAMGGDVTLRSALGQGSHFSFMALLPACTPPEEPNAGVAGLSEVQAQRPLRVLVAEDDEVNALIAVASLERMGVLVERVADGRQAVHAALRTVDRPDLVLMDCRMPVLDGYSATREIRSQEHAHGLPRLPVIALTATVTELGRAQCMEAGMDDFIAKPFSPEQLHAALRGWLGEAPPPSGLAEGSGR
jgi:signal transduction histidine kinase/CheY-like chemotaxis protein